MTMPFSATNEVHLWIVRTDVSYKDYETFRGILSSDECNHADRFMFDDDRVRYTISHAILRLLLAAHCERRPESLLFGLGYYGKPYLLNSSTPIEFSLSHSGSYA